MELFKSLLAPWKRDVSYKNWRGFQLGKSLGLFIENIFSRIIGAIVRSAVIITGLVAIACIFIFFLLIIITWLIPPLVIIFFIFAGMAALNLLIVAAAVLLAYIFFFYITFKDTHRLSYFDMDLEMLSRLKWFTRVWNRLELEANQIKKEWLTSPEGFQELLKQTETSEVDFQMVLDWEIKFQQNKENRSKFWLKENLDRIPPLGKHWRFAYTAKLDRYSLDLTHSDPTEYRKDDFVGREDELELVRIILERPEQNSVLIVGNYGTGRSTLIHNLARKIRLNEEDKFLEKKRILIFDLSQSIVDSIEKGISPEILLYDIFKEAAYAGNVIMVIQDFEKYFERSNAQNAINIAAILSEFLPLSSFQIIATSTPKEYHRLIEKEGSIMKYFETVEIKEPTEEESIRVLLKKFSTLEDQRIVFTFRALKKIVADSVNYHWGIPLPECALDLAEEVLLLWKEEPDTLWVTPDVVSKLIAMKTGAPQGEIQTNEKEKLLKLEEIMHRRIVGQKEAVSQVAGAMRRARTGINNPERPIGSFLFMGPTGVGKTETAKALAEGYYGDENRMIRFDMSEYQTRDSVDRMIGSQPANQNGILVTKVKDNPYSLILLDEIEKADPKVLDLFLQILDEGFVTDAFGEKVNFRNCIIIATSSAGANLIKDYVEKGSDFETIKNALVDQIVKDNIFRLEFLNRFDSIIVYHPLSGQDLRSVVSLLLYKIEKRARKEKNLNLIFEDDVIEKIIQSGYDPIFGARSVSRFIEDKIENIIANKIISGESQRGGEIYISAKDL